MIRVLISLAPRSYRESLAIVLQGERPESEVRVCLPDLLEAEAQSFEPHLVVCNDESYPKLEGIVYSRVEILFMDDLHANVSLDGKDETIRDVSLDDLFKVLDQTQELIHGSEPELPRSS